MKTALCVLVGICIGATAAFVFWRRSLPAPPLLIRADQLPFIDAVLDDINAL